MANNIVGTICHSLLLVPYHAWRITHGKHHNNTGSCENDEVFAPSTRTDWAKDMLRDTPFAQGVGLVIMLTVGIKGNLPIKEKLQYSRFRKIERKIEMTN